MAFCRCHWRDSSVPCHKEESLNLGCGWWLRVHTFFWWGIAVTGALRCSAGNGFCFVVSSTRLTIRWVLQCCPFTEFPDMFVHLWYFHIIRFDLLSALTGSFLWCNLSALVFMSNCLGHFCKESTFYFNIFFCYLYLKLYWNSWTYIWKTCQIKVPPAEEGLGIQLY